MDNPFHMTLIFLEAFEMRDMPTVTFSIVTTISSFVLKPEDELLFQVDFPVFLA